MIPSEGRPRPDRVEGGRKNQREIYMYRPPAQQILPHNNVEDQPSERAAVATEVFHAVESGVMTGSSASVPHVEHKHSPERGT